MVRTGSRVRFPVSAPFMPKIKKQNQKSRKRLQVVESDTGVDKAIAKNGEFISDVYIWTLSVTVLILVLLVWRGIATHPPKSTVLPDGNTYSLSYTIKDKSDLAKAITEHLNTISPTPPLTGFGWIAQRIEFIQGGSNAYVIYTDTSVTLRILVNLVYDTNSFSVTVAASFIPDENGNWQLQYGKDLSGRVVTEDYIYDVGAGEWIEQ